MYMLKTHTSYPSLLLKAATASCCAEDNDTAASLREITTADFLFCLNEAETKDRDSRSSSRNGAKTACMRSNRPPCMCKAPSATPPKTREVVRLQVECYCLACVHALVASQHQHQRCASLSCFWSVYNKSQTVGDAAWRHSQGC